MKNIESKKGSTVAPRATQGQGRITEVHDHSSAADLVAKMPRVGTSPGEVEIAAVEKPFIEAVNLIEHRLEKGQVAGGNRLHNLAVDRIVNYGIHPHPLGVDRSAHQSAFAAQQGRGDGNKPVNVGLSAGVAEGNDVRGCSPTAGVTLVRNSGGTPEWTGIVHPRNPRIRPTDRLEAVIGGVNDNAFSVERLTLRSEQFEGDSQFGLVFREDDH